MTDNARTLRLGFARLALALLHLAGGILALVVLVRAWERREIINLSVTQNALLSLLVSFSLLTPLSLLTIAGVSARELRVSFRRWTRGEPEPDVAARVRALSYAALACLLVTAFGLSTAESFSGPFRLRFPILGEIVTAFAYGAYLLWWRILPWLRRVVPLGVRRVVDIAGTNAVLVMVLAEITLRVAALVFPSPLIVTDKSGSQIRRDANRERPGTLRFGFPMNTGGHFDAEFVPRELTPNRVVVGIGDSFSYGAVPHPYHFTTLTERLLPSVDVYNMGYSGIGPRDYLYLLKNEATPLHPDLIVVNLFVGNDVQENASSFEASRWYDADSYLVAVVWYRLQIMRRARLVDPSEAATYANLTDDQVATLYPHLANPLVEKPSVTEDLFYAIETRNAIGICIPHDSLYRGFFRILAEIKAAAGDIPVAFMLIPEEFQVEDDIWREVGKRTGRALDRDLAQRTIVSWFQAQGLPVLDLLPLLRAIPPMGDGRRHLYHLRNLHFNLRGNDVAGRAYARFVDSMLTAAPTPVPLPPRLVFGNTMSRRWMKRGWSQDETANDRTYVWSSGSESALTVPLPRNKDVRMDFEANPFVFAQSPPQRVAVVLNGKELEQVTLNPGVHEYSVTLPRDWLRDTPNALEFRYAYTRAPSEVNPGSPDTRPLAVAWYSIEFEAASPADTAQAPKAAMAGRRKG